MSIIFFYLKKILLKIYFFKIFYFSCINDTTSTVTKSKMNEIFARKS